MKRQLFGMSADRVLGAMAIAVSASFLLLGYEFIRSTSQSLFIGAYGAKNLPMVMALGPIGTLVMIYVYGHLLSSLGAKRAIILTTLLSGATIIACYCAIRVNHSRLATGVLYVFREAYIVLLVEQVWSFINSTVVTQEGRKINGPVCGIASLGAICGGLLVQGFAVRVGSEHLLLLAAASLVPTGLLAALAYHWGGEPAPSPEEQGGRQGHLGVGVLWRNPTLRDLALLIVTTQVVSTFLDLQLSRYVEVSIPGKDLRTQWFGGFYAQLNGAAFLLQFIVAPLLLQYVSLRRIHVAIPLIHLTLCAAMIAKPGLATAAAAYFAFKALDYSVFRAAKELLYIPLSYDARYRAKELIDAFMYRLAKGGASAAMAIGTRLAVIPMMTYPVVTLASVLGWLPLAFRITRARPAARRLVRRLAETEAGG